MNPKDKPSALVRMPRTYVISGEAIKLIEAKSRSTGIKKEALVEQAILACYGGKKAA